MKRGLATRLYQGEAGLNVVGRRGLWFSIAGVLLLIALSSFVLRGFHLGVEFEGGNEFQVPASVGTLTEVEDAFKGAGADVTSAQELGGGDAQYLIRTKEMPAAEANTLKTEMTKELNVPAGKEISDSLVSGAWGKQVTERALQGLGIFLVLVMGYLVLRFEWRMAVAAVSALMMDLIVTAAVYSLVGFEVTPSTIIGFLTILGFALYDVVVVFDKIQENTRGITGSNTTTYGEAANLAVNQTLMRSINTSVVALLPVGGLLFIGAGLLGAGTLKDLSLVLFVGMGAAFFSSIFVASPLLVTLKGMEPRFKAHSQRVLARRAAIAAGKEVPGARGARPAGPATTEPGTPTAADSAELAGATPKVGSRPGGKRQSGGTRGRPGGRSGTKRR